MVGKRFKMGSKLFTGLANTQSGRVLEYFYLSSNGQFQHGFSERNALIKPPNKFYSGNYFSTSL